VKANENKLTHKRLLEVLIYDPSDGVFRCLVAYFYENGHWPSDAVIPADGDLDNARIANLRVVPSISKQELPNRRSDLTVDLIRRLFFYEHGRLFWAVHCPETHIYFGMEAGSLTNKGYRAINIGGKAYKAHRIAYAHHHGEWPGEGEVDHENLVKDDNRIENLRKATPLQQAANRRCKLSDTGVRGILRRRSKYKVTCGNRYVGFYSSLDDAILARQAAAQARWGEFARH
jgi:hypothetical protein